MGVAVVHQYSFDCDARACGEYLIVDVWRGGRMAADLEAREVHGWTVGKNVLCPTHRAQKGSADRGSEEGGER